MTLSDPSLSDSPPSRRCLATAASGQPCRAWAIKGGHYCRAHRPGPEHAITLHPPDPPRRLATIDDLIADLLEKLSLLSTRLDRAEDGQAMLQLMSVYSRACTHLARLMREQRLMPGPPGDDIMALLGQALDELGDELGIQL